MRTRKWRKGISLVELLTVIAIITLLLQILIPAIAAAKEAARRVACQNNLRQIGLAAHSHLSATERFPTGGWHWNWVGDPDRGNGDKQPGGWIYNLLPYLEYEDVHGLGRGADADAKRALAARLQATPVPVMVCASRRRAIAYPATRPTAVVNSEPAPVHARSDYAANAGDAFMPSGEGPISFEHAESDTYQFKDMSSMSGICFLRSLISARDVTDGMSHTYFAGEKYLPVEDYKSGSHPGDDFSMYQGMDNDILRWTALTVTARHLGAFDSPNPPIADRNKEVKGFGLNFGSAHAGGWNAVHCDGSVRMMSYTTDAEVHRAMGNRHDGQTPQE